MSILNIALRFLGKKKTTEELFLDITSDLNGLLNTFNEKDFSADLVKDIQILVTEKLRRLQFFKDRYPSVEICALRTWINGTIADLVGLEEHIETIKDGRKRSIGLSAINKLTDTLEKFEEELPLARKVA